ncbi:hypothetical protein FRC12_013843 [Ceratobasidium sp. 428]|nr:hypothetical protein FRC12_013843 [Ceratobasidium sp. 428]
MASHESLPPECWLRILVFLTLHDVPVLLATSKRWNTLISENENYVYARLAFNHGFLPTLLTSLEDARRGWISPAFENIQTWKQYCRVQLGAKRRWEGSQSAFVAKDLFGSEQEVGPHRFKIDVDKQLLAMTGGRESSALVVHCLRNPGRKSLFRIDEVKSFSHLEMSNGFLVFTCSDTTVLEVWRWAEDQRMHPVNCSPVLQQIHMYQAAVTSREYPTASSPIRGELVPVGILRQPGSLQALRLAYPSLCVGSQDGTHLWLWNIRTRELTQTIDMPTSNSLMFGMRYVDVNETHVFVATDVVSVYSRGTSQCVFRLTPEQLNRFCSSVHGPTQIDSSGSFHQFALHPYSSILTEVHRVPPDDRVTAVHVSPTGQDFVAITFCGYVLHVTSFDSIHRPAGQPPRCIDHRERTLVNPKVSVTRVSNSYITYLAYDGEHVVVTGPKGICMIILHPPASDDEVGEGEDLEICPFPTQTASFVPPFAGGDVPYDGASCLQLTKEGIWIAWPVNLRVIGREIPFRRARKAIGVIDFTRPQIPSPGYTLGSKVRRLSWG